MLTISIYKVGDRDQFKVFYVPEKGKMIDVTDEYEVAAVTTDDGRTGFTVVKRA